MKILTIGLDGGDERIIRAMPMPNLHKILDQNVCLDVEEDLWSRGWAEILSGVHGSESGGFYAKPLLEGTHNTTQRFSIADYVANPMINPLWSKLSEDGYKVGFMNVPSMMPAPEVNGFSVSGGGAGASISRAAGIPLEACYPNTIKEQFEYSGYIFDIRFVASGLRDMNVFVEQLIVMTKKRIKAFVELCKQYQSDFGFVAFVAICRVQYLALSEIEELIKNDGSPTNYFQEKILIFYQNFDKYVGKLVAELNPKHLILVSDHGQSPRLYSVNINSWLQKQGFQAPLSQSAGLLKRATKILASTLPQSIKQNIRRSAPKVSAKLTDLSVDWKNSKAFSVRYVPGIYINDYERFAGPVKSNENVQAIVEMIIASFNEDPDVQKHGFIARIYRQNFKEARYEALLPEIWIDHPDTCFFEQHGKFIEPNKDFGPIKSLEHVDRDMYTGIKGRRPLLCVDPPIADLVNEDDDRNLTLAYKLITRGIKM